MSCGISMRSFLVAGALVTQVLGQHCPLITNTTYAGATPYVAIDNVASSPDDCCTLCYIDNSRCLAFTWKDTDGGPQQCFLFDNIGSSEVQPAEGSFSGELSLGTPHPSSGQCPMISHHAFAERRMLDREHSFGWPDPEDCCQFCSDYPNCVAYEWQNVTGILPGACILYESFSPNSFVAGNLSFSGVPYLA